MSAQVIFDCERMKYPNNGLFSYCEQLGKVLTQQKPSNAKLGFYIPRGKEGFFGSDEEYILQHHLHKFFPKYIPNYNIWHCTFQGSNYFPARRMDAKLITTIHDLNFLHEGISTEDQNKQYNKIGRLIGRADRIVAISKFVKEDILKAFDVDKNKIQVIYHGHNQPPAGRFSRPAGNYERPFFFTIGTINPKKNFHVLPAMLLENDCELVIAGGGVEIDYKELIIETARQLGVADRVKIIGAVSDNEKYWLYNHCTAFCLPSLAEGFGAPVLEAMQFGTPVILSNATSLPEIGGPHAFYFDDFSTDVVKQTAVAFLNTPPSEKKKTLLVNWAKQFDWRSAAQKYWTLYQEVLSKHRLKHHQH